jgi:FkbM family methyltransferase
MVGNKRIIYDLGSNNGDDIPYYLLKSDLVVAVEANPRLCDLVKVRFAREIEVGKLIVENCVLDINESTQQVPFYIHKHAHVLSQFPPPDSSVISQFDEVYLPSKNVRELIHNYGKPYYVKIDIEHYDHVILRELLNHNIRPPYISAESHSIEVFSLLVALGKYNSFKLVDGETVSTRYKDAIITADAGPQKYSFPHHSAGPFGNDIGGPWMTPDNFFSLLGFTGLGWKDIHASDIDQPDPGYSPKPQVRLVVNF